MATKLRNATKCRDVPEPEVASRFALEHRARSIVSIMASSSRCGSPQLHHEFHACGPTLFARIGVMRAPNRHVCEARRSSRIKHRMHCGQSRAVATIPP
jgi:hypothetical protein